LLSRKDLTQEGFLEAPITINSGNFFQGVNIKEIPDKYRICLISFSSANNDARTLNLARAIGSEIPVCIVYPVSETQQNFFEDSVEFIPIKINQSRRVFPRWYSFCKKVSRLLKNSNISYVFAMDLYSLLPSALKKKKSQYKLFYDSREIYSALGTLYKNPFKQLILSLIERFLVNNVDEFIVSGSMDEEYLAKHFNTKKPFNVIMNVPFFRQIEKTNKIREELKLDSNINIIVYQGMILEGRGIRKIIESLQFLDNTVLCIFGEGQIEDVIYKTAQKYNVRDKVFYMGIKPYDELLDWTSSADLGVVFIRPISLSYKLALPNKLFEYCMAGIPSLVTDLPAMKKIIEEYHIGKLISHKANSIEIADAIRQILKKKEDYKKYCQIASQKLCYDTQIDKILNMINIKRE
jgi:glycosyltransferase involved in cell wall biosynthesis